MGGGAHACSPFMVHHHFYILGEKRSEALEWPPYQAEPLKLHAE